MHLADMSIMSLTWLVLFKSSTHNDSLLSLTECGITDRVGNEEKRDMGGRILVLFYFPSCFFFSMFLALCSFSPLLVCGYFKDELVMKDETRNGDGKRDGHDK